MISCATSRDVKHIHKDKKSRLGDNAPKRKAKQEKGEITTDGMTNSELKTLLETMADLVEAKAETVKEAAQIIREKAENLK